MHAENIAEPMAKIHDRERRLRVLIVSVKRATGKVRRDQTAVVGVSSNVDRGSFILDASRLPGSLC